METTKISAYAPVNGINMYYEIYGEGDLPLVLIHGGGSTIQSSFGNLLPLLADSGKIIAVELQAHGRTTDRDAPESFEQDADDVAALLKHLKISKANILGFSNGGTTTLQIALRHPQLVHKLISIAGAWKREGLIPGFFEGMQGASLDHMPHLLKDAYLKVNPDRKGFETMFEKDKQRMINFRDHNDDDLKAMQAPALLMVSDKDVVTIEHTAHMAQLIPDAQLVVLPGIHGSFIGEVCTVDHESSSISTAAGIIKEFLSERKQIMQRVRNMMRLQYGNDEPWCKILQLRDFDETYFTGFLVDEHDRENYKDEIATVHNYIKDPENAVYRDAFLRYFLEQVFTDHTPESMCIGHFVDQEWLVVSGAEAEARFDHIIRRSLEERKDLSGSGEGDYEKFVRLKHAFLDVFTSRVVFLVNTDRLEDTPAIVGMDGNTTGIFFLGS